MRVTHISTHYPRGGAARAMHRLHLALRAAGVDSRIVARHCLQPEPHVAGFMPRPTWSSRLARWRRQRQLRPIEAKLNLRPDRDFSPVSAPYGSELAQAVADSDVVHLHWISRFVDLPDFLAHLPATIPVVWTLHDMQPATGGCHYPGNCRRFETGCGACPQLDSSDPADFSAAAWQVRRATLRSQMSRPWRIVTPSAWLAREVRASQLAPPERVTVAPYGIDTRVFAPRSREAARETLQLPRDAAVVMFIADSVTNPRKGADLLLAALAAVRAPAGRPRILLTAGQGRVEAPAGWELRSFGAVNGDVWLTSLYTAADVVAIPSREDNLPLTMLEAMACGRCVAGFAIGGLPDLIRPGENGWLAAPENVGAYAEILTQALATSRSAMEALARATIETQCTLALDAERHQRLYAQLLA